MKLIHLYNQTHYSFLDSLISVEDLVKTNAKNGVSAVALTDHNNLFALGEFLDACKKYKIKPIIGVDLDTIINNYVYRIVLLAKNNVGYQRLNELIHFVNKHGPVPIEKFQDDDNLYLIDHPSKGFYTLDNRNMYSDFFEKNSNFYTIRKYKALSNNEIVVRENKILFASQNQALKTLQKIGNLPVSQIDFPDYDNEFSNDTDTIIFNRINEIVINCNVTFEKKNLNLAHFNNFTDQEAESYFNKLLEESVRARIDELEEYDSWLQRLNYERKVIRDFGFINYFLIIQDLIKWAKSQNIAIGPGRGSAAGSLVSYLLGITDVNPLKYDLLFERFLNPDRKTWPDIDIDIQDDRRNEVFEYVQQKYGYANTALISTFQTMGAKNSIRDVARTLGISVAEVNRISKLIPFNATLAETYAQNFAFRDAIQQHPNLYELAVQLEGLPRQYGYHPAGLIVANTPILKDLPAFEVSDMNFLQVQLSMKHIEEFGFLKIDLLGLKTLTEIADIEAEIPVEARFDSLYKRDSRVINDPSVLMMLNDGYTEGIFQLESNGMKSTIKKVKLEVFDDLYAVISLFRPGPKNYIDTYAQRKNEKVDYPKVERNYNAIVEKTYGIIVYQEQITQIAQKVALMSPGEADFLRRAISKKNEELIQEYQSKFIAGAVQNGLSHEFANEIYENIKLFGLYGFNKSHAVSYAYLTIKMAFYKCYYPAFFYKALVSNNSQSQDTIIQYVQEAQEMGFAVESPNIFYSSKKCEVHNNKLYLPFNIIKGFGAESVKKIVADKSIHKEYSQNLIETLLRLKAADIKNNHIETLIKANVFRDFNTIKNVLYIFNNVIDSLPKPPKNLDDPYTFYIQQAQALKSVEELMNNKALTINEIDYEKTCEEEALGTTFNAVYSRIYEKNYPKRLNEIKYGQPPSLYVVEFVSLKKNSGKNFYTLICKDTSKTMRFFLSSYLKEKFNGITTYKVVELKIEWNKANKNPQVLDWKGII
ncbi:DNA polymerase III subunit alpha [Mycoplasmopsis columbinasalis]|nr:DNA polymerase III subunit alpha [Mycoplasmopsis columbinasalis]